MPDREHEHVADRVPRPRDDDPHAIRRVGVLGGGTAGYLAALALRAKRPWLDVTLVESSRIPVIGVGEATTPPLTAFLHHYLGIDRSTSCTGETDVEAGHQVRLGAAPGRHHGSVRLG
jgi:tryptophan halogenase